MVATPPAQADHAIQYAADLVALKSDIASLRNMITSAVEEIKNAITSICNEHAFMPTSTAATMEIEADQSTEANHSKETTPELSDLITELKNDIATIAIEMREKFQEFRAPPLPIPFQLTPFPT